MTAASSVVNVRGQDVPHDPSLPATLQHVSSTQIKTFTECNRKWFFQKCRKISVPESFAQGLGKDVHAQLEGWANTGDIPDPDTRAGQIAANGIPFLPEWGNDLGAEVNIADPAQGPVLRCGGVPYVGYIDLTVPPRYFEGEPEPFFEPLELSPGFHGNGLISPPVIIDHKTTKNFVWVKSAEVLKTDPQVVSYGRWAAEKYFHVDWSSWKVDAHRIVRVSFPYYLTQFPRGKTPETFTGESVRRVDMSLRVMDMIEPWAGFEKNVAAMLELARNADKLEDRDVKGNLSSCDAWGGCPHRERCAKITKDDLDRQLVQLKLKKETPVTKSLNDLFGTDVAAEPIVVPSTQRPLFDNTPVEVIDVPRPIFAQPGFDLYVDAVPLYGMGPVVALESYLTPLNSQVVRDWNSAKNTSLVDMLEIDFGKWKGPLRALLVANPPSGAVVARSQGETSQVALEVLKPLARAVVQGVR